MALAKAQRELWQKNRGGGDVTMRHKSVSHPIKVERASRSGDRLWFHKKRQV